MLFKKSKNLITCALIVTLGLGYTPKSEALLPTTDIANLAENIAGNIQEMYNWAEQKTMMMFDMDMQALMSELGINNQNNAIANVIVRTGAAMQEIQNIEVIEQSVPDKDATDTITLQVMNETATCNAAEGVEASVKSSLEANCQFDTPEEEQQKLRKTIVDEFVEHCSLLVEEPVEDGQSPFNKTMCVKASILTGSGTLDTYTHDEANAVKRYIQLLVGVNPKLKSSFKYDKKNVAGQQKLIEEMRVEAVRSLVNTSLSEVAYTRISPSGGETESPLMSPMHILQDFDNARFGSTDWMSTLQNVNKGNKNSVYPSEVLRKIAVMDSFMVHMSVLKYKQQLRMEALEATSLALDVEPLK